MCFLTIFLLNNHTYAQRNGTHTISFECILKFLFTVAMHRDTSMCVLQIGACGPSRAKYQNISSALTQTQTQSKSKGLFTCSFMHSHSLWKKSGGKPQKWEKSWIVYCLRYKPCLLYSIYVFQFLFARFFNFHPPFSLPFDFIFLMLHALCISTNLSLKSHSKSN